MTAEDACVKLYRSSREGVNINKSQGHDLSRSFMALLTTLLSCSPVNMSTYSGEGISFQVAAKVLGIPPCCPGHCWADP